MPTIRPMEQLDLPVVTALTAQLGYPTPRCSAPSPAAIARRYQRIGYEITKTSHNFWKSLPSQPNTSCERLFRHQTTSHAPGCQPAHHL